MLEPVLLHHSTIKFRIKYPFDPNCFSCCKNKAKLSEIELKEKERELIPHEEHISILKNQIRGIKAGFLRLPKYVAPRLYQQEPKVICEMLDNELRYIIGQFSGRYYASKDKQKDS